MNISNRQKDFPWFESQRLLQIGAGGIGSFTALSLSRIGHHITLYEMDVIEPHNIGGQLFSISDIGSDKSSKIETFVRKYSNVSMDVMGEYGINSISDKYTILAVDNMEVRKIAVKKWYDMYIRGIENPDAILIDGRLEGEQGIIYTLTSEKDYLRWMEEWFPDDEIGEGACTMRATTYNGMMIAANMTAVFNNYRANLLMKNDIREVPFKIEYGFPGLIYDIIR